MRKIGIGGVIIGLTPLFICMMVAFILDADILSPMQFMLLMLGSSLWLITGTSFIAYSIKKQPK